MNNETEPNETPISFRYHLKIQCVSRYDVFNKALSLKLKSLEI